MPAAKRECDDAVNSMPEKKSAVAGGPECTLWLWLDDFSACVRARDYARARRLFARDAHGFGTAVKAAGSRARLEKMQWARVWPVTSGFCFERAGARIIVSADQAQAVVMVMWKACNQAAPKRLVFDRQGRATVVLRRRRADAPWLAEHTHFSFDPANSMKGFPSA